MPTLEEEVEDLKSRIELVKSSIDYIRGTISDLRAAGLPTAEREAEIKPLEDEVRKWKTYLSLRMKRAS